MGNRECRRRRVPGPRGLNMTENSKAGSIDLTIQRIEVNRPKNEEKSETDIQGGRNPPKGKPQAGSYLLMNTNQ